MIKISNLKCRFSMLKSTEIKDNGALFYILLLKSNVG